MLKLLKNMFYANSKVIVSPGPVKLKIGDTVMLTKHGHQQYRVSAYAGYTGKVSDVYDDGSFALENRSSCMVVPAWGPFGKSDYIKIILNGKKFTHRFIYTS